MVYDISFALFSFWLQYSQCTLEILRGNTYPSTGHIFKKQHSDLLFLMTPVQKKILCALHADLLRSDTNCLWLVNLTKIFLGFPALSSPSLEATDSKGHFQLSLLYLCISKNMEHLRSVKMRSGTYWACLENWVPCAYQLSSCMDNQRTCTQNLLITWLIHLFARHHRFLWEKEIESAQTAGKENNSTTAFYVSQHP